VRYVTGLEVTRISAEYGTYATPVEVEDFLVATVRYRSGAVGHIQAGSCIRGAARVPAPAVRIYGSEGQVVLDNPPRVFAAHDVDGMRSEGWETVGSPVTGYTHTLMLDAFAKSILAGEAPPASGEDGRVALQVVLGAYQSGATGVPVELKHDRGVVR